MESQEEDTLMHYGVLGMHWGIRKSASSGGVATAHTPSEDHARATAALARPAHSLSNTEMQHLITRLDLEKRYAAATAGVNAKPQTRGGKLLRSGRKFATDLILDVGRQEISRVVKAKTSLEVESRLAKNPKTADIADRITPKKKKK